MLCKKTLSFANIEGMRNKSANGMNTYQYPQFFLLTIVSPFNQFFEYSIFRSIYFISQNLEFPAINLIKVSNKYKNSDSRNQYQLSVCILFTRQLIQVLLSFNQINHLLIEVPRRLTDHLAVSNRKPIQT